MIYSIKKLQCKYPSKDNIVLDVESLKIDQGDIIFILGPSGVGKSTLLETLGLMTKTVYKAEEFSFHGQENLITDLSTIWNKNEIDISNFRNDCLSFMFQSTNLFAHLTAFENVIMPALMQGLNEYIVVRKAKQLFDQFLPGEDYEKRVSEYSGGQRQRIAFIRAILADYIVLLADEPTGNLDANNADLLMKEIVSSIKKDNKTAIIVSHDIALSLKHATKIVLIDRQVNGGISKGSIKVDSLFVKNNDLWSNTEVTYDHNDMKQLMHKRLLS